MGLYFSLSKALVKSGEIVCPNKCPELTKAPCNAAANLKNNFYLIPKVEERRADDLKKFVEMVDNIKENRKKNLNTSRQSLVILKATRNLMQALSIRSERAVQYQTQTVAVNQSAIDKPHIEPKEAVNKGQYEKELKVRNRILGKFSVCFHHGFQYFTGIRKRPGKFASSVK